MTKSRECACTLYCIECFVCRIQYTVPISGHEIVGSHIRLATFTIISSIQSVYLPSRISLFLQWTVQLHFTIGAKMIYYFVASYCKNLIEEGSIMVP